MKNFSLSLTTRQAFDSQVSALLSANTSQSFYVSVIKKEAKRGLPPNAQQHFWYGQIAKHHGDRSPLDVKNMCKDVFGLPILLNSESYGDKLEFLLHKLDYYRHSYESKMKLIQCLSVTSEFTTQESKLYMEHMVFYFNDLGVPIKFKDK